MHGLWTGIVWFLSVVFKTVSWIVLNACRLVLVMMQIFLLLLSLVLRVFFAFVKVGTV